jgi:phosphocarrier protein
MAEARSLMNETPARKVTIANQRGLHARAAAKFVKLAETFEAEVTVIKNDVEVPGGSIMGLMMLAAAPGSEIEIRSEGPDASAALIALVRLVEDKFHEE